MGWTEFVMALFDYRKLTPGAFLKFVSAAVENVVVDWQEENGLDGVIEGGTG